jgi:hypothetical protein
MSATAIPRKVVKAVLDRDGGMCVLASFGCLREGKHCDHRVGRGAGGNKALNVAVNLVAVCTICNSLKEDDAQFARECSRRGLNIRRSQSTATDLERAAAIPVCYPDGTWWVLTTDGRVQIRDDEAAELIALYGLDRAKGAGW